MSKVFDYKWEEYLKEEDEKRSQRYNAWCRNLYYSKVVKCGNIGSVDASLSENPPAYRDHENLEILRITKNKKILVLSQN